MDAASILRSARASSGRTQADLALAAGTLQPALARLERATEDPTVGRLDRILEQVGIQVSALPTRLSTVASWAHAFRDWIRADDLVSVRSAFVQISDDLRSVDGATAVGLCLLAPAPTGHEGVDAALAALVEFTLNRSNLPVPAWVAGKPAASDPFYLVPNKSLRSHVEASTPLPFRGRNVHVPGEYFESV